MSLVWDAASGRYRDASSGRFVREDAFRASFDALVNDSRDRMAEMTGRLRAGGLSLPQWQEAARVELRNLHVTAGSLAQGGAQSMTPASYGRTGQLLRTQYGYLAAVAEQIASGARPLDGRLDQSARLFSGAARDTFAQLQRAQARGRGVQEEMRVLGATDHCDDCVDAADEWAPLGSLPRIGESACRQNCACAFMYRTAGEAA